MLYILFFCEEKRLGMSMRKLRNVSFSWDIENTLQAMGCDIETAHYQRRAAHVRTMWADVVDPIFLPHTNAVFIKRKSDIKQLIVYVDESIYAAELNARCELIKLRLLQRYGEDIDEFKILISRGAYKKNHPFIQEESPTTCTEQAQPIPLNDQQKASLSTALARVNNPELRQRLARAAQADIEWKNGIKVKKDKRKKD